MVSAEAQGRSSEAEITEPLALDVECGGGREHKCCIGISPCFHQERDVSNNRSDRYKIGSDSQASVTKLLNPPNP